MLCQPNNLLTRRTDKQVDRESSRLIGRKTDADTDDQQRERERVRDVQGWRQTKREREKTDCPVLLYGKGQHKIGNSFIDQE